MSNDWLLKTEPSTYSYNDLARDGGTRWDGVSNALALQHLRQMRKGDRVFIYHSGDEKQIVGIARVSRDPYPDPKLDDPKRVVIDLAPEERLPAPVTLSTIKADKMLTHSKRDEEPFALVRFSRLSVMPVSPSRWDRVIALARKNDRK